MALLTIAEREKYLKKLGYGKYSSASVKKLQKDYFYNPKDIDGIYGKNTDILLRHVYNVKYNCSNFAPSEFACECGGKYCTGYPDYMKVEMLVLIQEIRDHYKKPIRITSGLRCKTQNNLDGGITRSKHLSGKALDWYNASLTQSLTSRKEIIRTIMKFKNHCYSYCNGFDSSFKKVYNIGMGNSIHTEVK